MTDRFQLNFTELAGNDRAGYGFQALIAEIGRLQGYDVEESGTGPDAGRDLFFDIPYSGLYSKKEKKKWLVSCKDFAQSGRSVRRRDIEGGFDDAAGHDCYGYLIACTTTVVDDVVRMLRGWQRRANPIFTHIWTKNTINRLLHERENDFRLTLARFFPNSYGITNRASDQVITSLIELLQEVELDEAIPHAVNVTENEDDTLVRWRLAEAILERTPSIEHCHQLLTIWAADERQNFQTALESSLLDYFANHEDYMNEIGDELHPEVPSAPGYSIGSVFAEISGIELETDEDSDILIKCTGSANAELIDSIDGDSTSMSFDSTFTIRVSEDDYKVEDINVVHPADDEDPEED